MYVLNLTLDSERWDKPCDNFLHIFILVYMNYFIKYDIFYIYIYKVLYIL